VRWSLKSFAETVAATVASCIEHAHNVSFKQLSSSSSSSSAAAAAAAALEVSL